MPSSTMKHIWIPPEVLSSIFKRLPVRSLIQVQWACKDWKNLLNDQSFIQEYLRYTTHENRYLLFPGDTVLILLELYVIDSEMQVLQVESVPLIEFSRVATVSSEIVPSIADSKSAIVSSSVQGVSSARSSTSSFCGDHCNLKIFVGKMGVRYETISAEQFSKSFIAGPLLKLSPSNYSFQNC
ncbi:hypothetical protein K1719_016577 [Acacia pycnantha]|nr:hypothetical protein K1719_016577 [Acacia pycnantha]